MALFNSEWLKVDEHAVFIIGSGATISPILTIIEREIRSVCSFYKVAVADLEVDNGGYITSDALITYATAYGLYKLCSSFHGSARGEKDVYYDKKGDYFAEMQYARSNLSYNSIIANQSSNADTGEPLGVQAEFCPLIL